MDTTQWERRADEEGSYAIALGLMAVARAIQDLGNGDAATKMGALEAFGLHIGKKMDRLTEALEDLSEHE